MLAAAAESGVAAKYARVFTPLPCSLPIVYNMYTQARIRAASLRYQGECIGATAYYIRFQAVSGGGEIGNRLQKLRVIADVDEERTNGRTDGWTDGRGRAATLTIASAILTWPVSPRFKAYIRSVVHVTRTSNVVFLDYALR